MNGKEQCCESRVLDGHTYTLNPSDIKMGSSPGIVKTVTKYTLGFLLFPVWLPCSMLGFFILWMTPKAVRMRFLAYFLPRCMDYLAQMFQSTRSLLLGNIRGRVLDVGCGGAAYFEYFTEAIEIVAIEPVEALHATIRQRAEAYGVLERLRITTKAVEDYYASPDNQDGYFDWIILGNVMCEVDDPKSTLQVVVQQLRPGTGRLYFSEHVARTDWMRFIQDLMNPFWKVVSVGCNINRDSLRFIEDMSELEVISWQYPQCTVGMGPIVVGLARRVPLNDQQRLDETFD